MQEKIPQEYDGCKCFVQKNRLIVWLERFLILTKPPEPPAFVSDKFKTFDNVNLLNASLPQLMESDAQWQVVNGTVTDKRLYLRLKSEVQTGVPAVGDKWLMVSV